MSASFQRDGVSFRYPENWVLTREDLENGWTVTLQSPNSSFFVLTYDSDMPDVGDVAQTALEALRTDYPDLDADEAVEALAGQPALGHDVSFFSLDLTNTCCTRCLYCEGGTLFVMWQANDLDLDLVDPVFRAIRASLRVAND